MENQNGWTVEVKVTVKGPKEGAIVATLNYEDTTKDIALSVQNKIATTLVEMNG